MATSEQLLQVVPQKIGKFLYYRLGETTINQLKDFGLIPLRDYGDLIKKKPDGLIVYHKDVKGIVESKSPEELTTENQERAAIDQEKEVARKLCKLLIITDNISKTLWINALNGERIRNKDGDEIRTLFDSKFAKHVSEIERLIDDIDISLSESRSQLQEEKIIDPSDLARQMWQTIWVATGKSPIKCLYNVVELLIFKFLSDLNILEEEYRFNKVYEMSKTRPETALIFYANNPRKQVYTLFPEGDDKTTIINGTIFVNEQGEPNLSQAVLFHHSLKHLYEYDVNFGSFIKIDKNFKTKLYETFLKQEVEALGQYFTTRKIVQSIVRMSRLDEEDFPYQGKRICDPFCGVGGFLLEILNLNEKMKQCFVPDDNGKVNPPFVLEGFDKGFEREDERTIILAKANMLIYLTDIVFRHPKLTLEFAKTFNQTFTLFRDNLATFSHIITSEAGKYDYILTNPPYVTRGSKIIKEEIKSKGLSKYYPINAYGLEGLAIEWVIRSLKPSGKAFIIVPDGVMERKVDKKLRNHILKECYLDAIISLPVRTFYANFRKTYILALTKKEGVNDIQKHNVFSYLVSDIGEDLTKKNRDEIQTNNLPEMEKLFAMYSAVKDDPTAYALINSPRCKLIDVNSLKNSKHWRVEKWWTEEDLKKLGIVEEEVELKSIIGSLENTRGMVERLMSERDTTPYIGSLVTTPKISDLFDVFKGSAGYTRKWIKSHVGDYPLYSSQTSHEGIIGMINKYDYDVKQCLTWTTDGVYAGTVFLREGKFGMTSHAGALILKDKLNGIYLAYDVNEIYLPYVYHILKNKLRKYALGQEHQNKRVTVDVIKEMDIEIPIIDERTFDIKRQQEIAMQFDKYELAFDEAMHAKDELITTLQKALGR